MFLVTLSFQNRVTARAGGRSRRSSNEGINDLELHAEEESNRWWLLKHQFIRSEMQCKLVDFLEWEGAFLNKSAEHH